MKKSVRKENSSEVEGENCVLSLLRVLSVLDVLSVLIVLSVVGTLSTFGALKQILRPGGSLRPSMSSHITSGEQAGHREQSAIGKENLRLGWTTVSTTQFIFFDPIFF